MIHMIYKLKIFYNMSTQETKSASALSCEYYKELATLFFNTKIKNQSDFIEDYKAGNLVHGAAFNVSGKLYKATVDELCNHTVVRDAEMKLFYHKDQGYIFTIDLRACDGLLTWYSLETKKEIRTSCFSGWGTISKEDYDQEKLWLSEIELLSTYEDSHIKWS
jgi:hypothetical protein